ncbi:CrcB family protein [Pseudonocardia nematodicida]|uniref:Fluoride-specific ion channel FluC n=1 Tax=Pseudonocardia nematodicida TaxID=1206997 RepID=A0ABV1K4M3_9PSEU
MTALLVAVGAAVGAPLRYLVDAELRARRATAFPWGTWLVNVAGSLLLGAVVAAVPLLGPTVGPATAALLGTGLCGALTTYSTFGWEMVSLLERGRALLATGYATVSVLAGVSAGLTGYGLVTLLAGGG